MAREGLSGKLLVPQRLGFGGLAFLLIVMSTFSALAMDMFSPSLPTMTQEFGIGPTEGSLAITLFFLFYSIGMLAFGTLSDKFGRKPMLIFCMAAFIAGGVFCALAVSFPMLIAFRVVQALGGGGSAAVGTALLKDVFSDEPREKFLMFMAVIQVIGPIAAPIIGGVVITFATWHTVFWILAGVGALCLVLVLFFNESLPADARLTESALLSYKRMGVVLKDKAFTVFLLATVLPSIAFGGYLAVGSYVYIDLFGTSEAVFGMWFAATALISMAGPALYTQLVKRISRKTLITAMILAPILTAALLFAFGHVNEVVFTLCFVPVTVTSAAMRPAMTAILLQQNERDAGSAAGIISFSNTMVGAVGMAIAGALAFDFVFGLAVLALGGAAVSALFWLYFNRSSLTLRAFEEEKDGTPGN